MTYRCVRNAMIVRAALVAESRPDVYNRSSYQKRLRSHALGTGPWLSPPYLSRRESLASRRSYSLVVAGQEPGYERLEVLQLLYAHHVQTFARAAVTEQIRCESSDHP